MSTHTSELSSGALRWMAVGNGMAILTHYPPAFEEMGEVGTGSNEAPTLICADAACVRVCQVDVPFAICLKRLGDWNLPVSG